MFEKVSVSQHNRSFLRHWTKFAKEKQSIMIRDAKGTDLNSHYYRHVGQGDIKFVAYSVLKHPENLPCPLSTLECRLP